MKQVANDRVLNSLRAGVLAAVMMVSGCFVAALLLSDSVAATTQENTLGE